MFIDSVFLQTELLCRTLKLRSLKKSILNEHIRINYSNYSSFISNPVIRTLSAYGKHLLALWYLIVALLIRILHACFKSYQEQT